MGSSTNAGHKSRFNKQSSSFWNRLRLLGAGLLTGVLFVSCAAPGGINTPGADTSKERRRASREVAVFVELEKPSGDFQGISGAQIQNDICLKLGQAGIRVSPHKKPSSSSGRLPIIYVNISIAKCETMYAYNADIIYFASSSAKSGKGTLGTSGMVADIAQVRWKVSDLMNRFIKDYLSV